MILATSPERNTFQRDSYIERQTEKGLMDDSETIAMIEWYEKIIQQKMDREQDPDWQQNNLEYDLRTTDWILKKVRESDFYAQNLYAALCNNDFIKNEVWPMLKQEYWDCSWRDAGGIIADMREEGDYVDWYCRGITRNSETMEVSEGMITEEIRADLCRLGWLIKEDSHGLE